RLEGRPPSLLRADFMGNSIAEVIATMHAPWRYGLAALGLQILVRVILSYFSTEQILLTAREVPRLRLFWWCLKGRFPFGTPQAKDSDLLAPAFLGLIETLAYPMLLAIKDGGTGVIGAWIGFKAVAQWKRWADDRTSFQRFLLGNALVVLSSFV